MTSTSIYFVIQEGKIEPNRACSPEWGAVSTVDP